MRLKKMTIIFISFIILGMMYIKPVEAQIKIGVFADCQYCDYETAGNRYYRNSKDKLSNCISEFNQQKKLRFIVGLGDLIDRDFNSFAHLEPILQSSKRKIFHVTGNHDFEVENNLLEKVPEKLNLNSTYYSFSKKGWQFIFLNGNEITFKSNDQDIIDQAEKMVEELKLKNKPNLHKWNGGMSEVQLSWLEKQLQIAEKSNKKVILFCHYPLLPLEDHALWNSEEVLDLLNRYSCVKAWLNGHNHKGNYAIQNGIHFITFTGMVDTETENAYATIELSKDKIEMVGKGREKSRSLVIK